MLRVAPITEEKRARNVALAGLALQLLLTATVLLMWLTTHSRAALLTALFMSTGLLIWIPLIIIYEQRRRVAREALESEQLREERAAGAVTGLFELEGEEFLVAQRRLRWLYRWLLPFFVLLAIADLLINYWQTWPLLATSAWNHEAWPSVRGAKLAMFCIGGVAFVAFLFSRYTAGMARIHHWRMLKSGSVFLFGNALAALALVPCLALADTIPIPERILAQVIGVVLLLLGLEFMVNFVLDFYRPRAAGQEIRPAFESRLLALVSDPGDIARSIADAVNYQFGFEVSSTWFYRTLQQNVVRMAAVAVSLLLLMSCMVIVDAHQMGVKERWGRRLEPSLEPGLHFKWPWPVERVFRVDVGLVKELSIWTPKGSQEKEEDRHLVTWTEEHPFISSIDLIVATPELTRLSEIEQEDQGTDVAVSILRVAMPVQYRIRKDGLIDYLYNYEDPQALLRDIAQRELVKQAVSFDYQRIMAEQRETVSHQLQEDIQARCDDMRLGLEIVFVGLHDIHPPTESQVAATFQKVATAEQQRQALIQRAEIDYAKTLIDTAGDVGRALYIDEIIRRRSALPVEDTTGRQAADDEFRRYMLGDAQTGVQPIRGNSGQILAEARAQAVRMTSEAAAKAATFELELAAYQASPELYMTRKLLQAVSSELDHIRKYVLVVNPETTQVVIELDETQAGGLEILDTQKK
jgi:regulator of protease activity HflC (stomatin/prohibitin superfamily)